MKTVKNGQEKYQAYKQNFSMLNKAMKYHFYLEAVAITYAMMEDRLVSFLHHAGVVTRDKGDMSINGKVYPQMRELMGKTETESIRIKNISVKIEVIQKLLELSEEKAAEIDAAAVAKTAHKPKRKRAIEDYMQQLRKQVQATVDHDNAMDVLNAVDKWRQYRNPLIHALMSKTTETSEITKKICAEEGCDLVRSLDHILVKDFKKDNQLRKKYNIQ